MPNALHALFSRARGTVSAPGSEPPSPKKERRSKDDTALSAARELYRERERDVDRIDEEEHGEEVEGRGGAVEQELRRLQRAYKVLEAERRSYADSATQTIAKQKSAIATMRDENAELERQVEVLTKMKVKSRPADFETVKREIASYTSKISTLTSSVNETNQSISSLQSRMAQLRQLASGTHSLTSESQALASQLRSAESRLDKATEKYNELLIAGRRLREQVTSVRHELVAYTQAWRRLEREAGEIKRRSGELVQATNAANAARDASQVQLLRLREVQAREREAFEREARENRRRREADEELRSFLAEKLRERSEKKVELERERRELERASGSIPAMLVARTPRETVEVYTEALDELKEMVAAWEDAGASGQGDLGDPKQLVARFVQLEHRGYSLFGYVNELGMQAAGHRAKLAAMRAEIDEADKKRRIKQEGEDERRDRLQRALASTTSRTEHLQSQLSLHRDSLSSFLSACRALCTKLSSLPPIVPARVRFVPPAALQLASTPEAAMDVLRFAEEKALELLALKERLIGAPVPPAPGAGGVGSRPGTAGYGRGGSRPGTSSAAEGGEGGHPRGRRRSSAFFGIGSSPPRTGAAEEGHAEEAMGRVSSKGSRAATPAREKQGEGEKRGGWVPFETPSVTREDWDAPGLEEEEEGAARLLSREELLKKARARIDRRKRAASPQAVAEALVPPTPKPKRSTSPSVSFAKQADGDRSRAGKRLSS
ncbi:hypothetical protein DFJ74DRAFT_291479 [Hyaloraphidium curvatum]|nr:hypothetical protein DFJ74DRAFT_291479 [Hyaloraphidium curvatum]